MNILNKYNESVAPNWTVEDHRAFLNALISMFSAQCVKFFDDHGEQFYTRLILKELGNESSFESELEREVLPGFLEVECTGIMDSERLAMSLYESGYFDLKSKCKSEGFVVEGVSFPAGNFAGEIDYNLLLSLFGDVTFKACDFYSREVLSGQQIDYVRFDSCTFNSPFKPYFRNEYSSRFALFDNCVFKEPVHIQGGVSNYRYECVFDTCVAVSVQVEGCELDFPLFSGGEDRFSQIGELIVYDSSLQSPVLLDDQPSISLEIFDSRIEGLSLKNSGVVSCRLVNASFSQAVSFTESNIDRFEIERVDFFGFSRFDGCCFGRGSNVDADLDVVQLNESVFHKPVIFRKTRFYQKLDLRNASFMQVPTFLDSVFEGDAKDKTDRETYRIIKQSFLEVGNQIEAGRFYALEMEAYLQELKAIKGKGFSDWWEYLLISINQLLSKHGQSYVRPLAVVLGLAGMLALGVMLRPFVLGCLPEGLKTAIFLVNEFLNELAKGVIVFRPIYSGFPGFEFLAVFYSILISTCIWHFLVAVRRHSKK